METVRKAKTYKQLVEMISNVQDWDGICKAEGEADFAYQHEKITYKDLQVLFRICGALSHAVEVPED